MSMNLIICRHTQTDDNANKMYTGHNEPPLNSVGQEQAIKLAESLALLPNVSAIVSSDLLRTTMLAEIIGEKLGLKPTFTVELREVHVGAMAGMSKVDALLKYPDDKYRSGNKYFDYRDIGGENHEDVLRRFLIRLNMIYNEWGRHSIVENNVVLVSHGTALRRIFVDEYQCIEALHPQGEYQVIDMNWMK